MENGELFIDILKKSLAGEERKMKTRLITMKRLHPKWDISHLGGQCRLVPGKCRDQKTGIPVRTKLAKVKSQRERQSYHYDTKCSRKKPGIYYSGQKKNHEWGIVFDHVTLDHKRSAQGKVICSVRNTETTLRFHCTTRSFTAKRFSRSSGA